MGMESFAASSDQEKLDQEGGLVSLKEWKRKTVSRSTNSDATTLEPVLKKRKQKPVLSFDMNEECASPREGERVSIITKCPEVDVSFLPDKDKELQNKVLRNKLKQKYLDDQEQTKRQPLLITYSYWDGCGHRKEIEMTKGDTVLEFLDQVCRTIKSEYKELKMLRGIDLLYIKEDCILPHACTFYELIVSKAMGLTGPLFQFDVHDDVRLKTDVRVARDVSHPGKIVTKTWYNRHKHIHPASKWIHYRGEDQ